MLYNKNPNLAGEQLDCVTEADFRNFVSPGGSQLSLDGGTIASLAGVWGPPQGFITIVSGALAITGITVPYATFSGMIVMIPTGAFTWTVATNIALAGTAVVGKALFMTYLPSTSKWYPNYIA
jgi:hypothetical protein